MEEHELFQQERSKWIEVLTKEKSATKDEIQEKFFEKFTKKRIDIMEKLFDDLKNRDTRSMVLIGAAYIEELCKECLVSTFTSTSAKNFMNIHGTAITFSFTSNFLHAQDYISEEILALITQLRKIRNDFAHNAVLSETHQKSIDSRFQEINKIMNGRILTRFSEAVNKMSPEQKTCFVLIEMLCYSLINLSMWIIPDTKLAKITLRKDYPFMNVYIWIDNFNPSTTLHKFELKFQ